MPDTHDTGGRLERGRTLVLADVLILVGFSLFSVLYHVASRGSELLGVSLLQLGVTALLCWLLYRGFALVRYLTIALITLSLMMSVPALVDSVRLGQPFLALLFVAVLLTYGFVAVTLAWERQVRDFLEAQRLARG